AQLNFNSHQFGGWINEYWREGKYAKDRIDPKILQAAGEVHYVLVAGFLNEGAKGYFRPVKETLLRYGVPKDHIHLISPPSNRAIRDGAQWLDGELRRLPIFSSSEDDPSIVLIGHSKGAAESLV